MINEVNVTHLCLADEESSLDEGLVMTLIKISITCCKLQSIRHRDGPQCIVGVSRCMHLHVYDQVPRMFRSAADFSP